jgi:hypothetical protein
MAAPKNNTNASKWTEERVHQHLIEIKALARDPKELFLRRVLAKLDLYREVWTYWRRKFAGDEDLMDEMNLIKDMFESNLFIAGLKGEISAPFTIMCLKANYGWSEYHNAEIADAPDITHRKRRTSLADITIEKRIYEHANERQLAA